MMEFTNAETGFKFLIDKALIKVVTLDKDRSVFVWIDLEKNHGYKVKETFNSVRKALA